MKVGDIVKLRPGPEADRSNFQGGVGLIVEHQGETKGWEDCYYKIMWRGPWYTWEDVCDLEPVNESR